MKIRAEITAYYPSNEGVEGGYYDSLGNLLNPDHNTCACPKQIPFHSMIKIGGTGTKYDGQIYECLDRGSAIEIDDDGVYHIDLLMHNKEEANAFGRRKNAYIEILEGTEINMSKFKVSIDAGHGMNTGGKRTPKLKRDLVIDGKVVKHKGSIIHEFEFNIEVAKALRKALERCGVEAKIVNDETGRIDTPLNTRARTANTYGSDLHISCHYNAVGSCTAFQSKAKGLLVLKTKGGQAKSTALANAIHNELKDNYSHDYGVGIDTQWSGFTLAILRQTHMPAVLIEYGFMDYEEEAMKMLDPKWYTKLAEDTCKGICKYLGIKYIAAKDKPKEPEKDDDGKKQGASAQRPEEFKQYLAKPTVDGLNCRKGPGAEFNIEQTIDTDVAITIVDEVKASDGGTWCKAKSGYYMNKAYMQFLRYI